MLSRQTLGLAALVLVALAGCVLIDSCLEDCTYIGSDGDGADAPTPNFEIAGKTPGIPLDILAAPVLLDLSISPGETVERPASAEADALPPVPKPVDPAGWLGRRHFRSPT